MLKFKYGSKDLIPEGYKDLYEEKNGEWVLKPIDGMKPESEFTELNSKLTNAEKAKKEAESKLSKFGDLDPDQVYKDIDTLKELQAKGAGGDGKLSEEQINTIVNSRTGELQRELKDANKLIESLTGERDNLKNDSVKGKRNDLVYKLAGDKVRKEAMPDALLWAETNLKYNEADGKFYTEDNKAADTAFNERLSNSAWQKSSTGEGDKGASTIVHGNDVAGKRAELNNILNRENFSPKDQAEAHVIAAEIKQMEAKEK